MPFIQLPLRHVALFSSGVGFFSRAATLAGAGECELLFKTGDINDILKSLVLLDPHGGARHVSYDAKEEAQEYLQRVGIELAPDASPSDVLQQFQGVEMQAETFDSRTLKGRLLCVSRREVASEGEKVSRDVLSLFGETGLQSVLMDDVSSLQVLDEVRQRDLNEALAMLGAERGGERRAVRIHFESSKAEEREVRLSYGHEVPLWKTSYRLVLGEESPFLQGWAIVENTSEEDWDGVELSLIAGRPISFVQDLYSPLHAFRPTVAPQILQSPLPQLYEQTLEPMPSPPAPRSAPAPEIMRGGGVASAKRARQQAVAANSGGAYLADEMLLETSLGSFQEGSTLSSADMFDLEPSAQGSERGELFEYSIAHPVSIAKRTSAMVPIVGGSVEGEKLSIYNPTVFARALRGFLLKNTSGVHLAGGPLTVFDDDLYAGDAQIADVTPGDERLISYAVDLDLVASHKEKDEPSVQIGLKASYGVLYFSMRMQCITSYEFRNTGSRPRTVLIQRPLDSWKIIEPAFEKTPGEARFRLPVEPGALVKLKVVREKVAANTVQLGSANESRLLEIATDELASPALRAGLTELAAMKRAEFEAKRREEAAQKELDSIAKEQERIRANMDKLDHKSALYNQYVAKLTAQEERIEALRVEFEAAREDSARAQEKVREFVRNFSFD